MKVLITGGTGFVGSNISARLVAEGHEVWLTGSEGEAGVCEGARLVRWEDAAREGFDACVHQAANNDTLDGDAGGMIEANVFRPAALFNSLLKGGCGRFVYASSTAVYGNRPAPYAETTPPDPLNVYAKSKLAFDEFAMAFAEESGAEVFGLRYCNVYGPGESHKGRRASMVRHLSMQILRGERPRIFKDGDQRRDWVYVEDVVDANLACLSAPKGGIFNVAGGRGVSFNHLVRVLNEAVGNTLEPEYIECGFKDRYQNDTECDVSRAREAIGWSPRYDIERGVREYLPLLRASL